MSNAKTREAMKIIWESESEGRKWEDLYEYPYNDFERKAIMARLIATAEKLEKHFTK